MDVISVGCQLVPSLFYVAPGGAGGKFTDHISLGALGRVYRTADVLPQIPVTCYGPSTRESGWLLGYRFYDIHSGAAGIDIEAVAGCVSIPIPTASGLLLHVTADWYVS